MVTAPTYLAHQNYFSAMQHFSSSLEFRAQTRRNESEERVDVMNGDVNKTRRAGTIRPESTLR